MADAPPSTRRRNVLIAILAAALVIAILLLLRGCPKPALPAFDYFYAKAEELGRDPARVAKFVKDDVRTLAYHGNVKGALGALWDGAGSPEEKLLLLAAILRHCPGAPAAAVEGTQPGAPDCKLTITHRGARSSQVFEGPVAMLVGDVHSIEFPTPTSTLFTFRPAANVTMTQSVETGGAAVEEVEFTVERPGGERVSVVRELWRRDNRIGPMAAGRGDRHDFVVLPCRITKYVREKEELLLKNRDREKAAEAKPYLGLLDYCLRADTALADLEKALKVRAQFETPRILLLSSWKLPVNHPVYGFDLRLNRTAFEGDAATAMLAAHVRSFVEAGLEQRFLESWSGMPATSAHDVFSRLRDDYPNRMDRRLELAAAALAVLLERGGADAKATFKALGRASPVITVRRTTDGQLALDGHRMPDEFPQKCEEARAVIGRQASPAKAAMAVEIALMAHADAKPSLPADFVLEANLDLGAEPLVAPGSRFEFRWGEGEARTEQRIEIQSCGAALEYDWTVRTGLRPARGARYIAGAALGDATTHNPWYVSGASEQENATSFCVSRRAHAALTAGRPCDFTLLGRFGPNDDPLGPRPVEWKGQLAPAGTGTHRVSVNGREETLNVLKAKAGDAEIAILDDAWFPVGMADKLVDVRTSVRGRVVDEAGLGIWRATVIVGEDGDDQAETWPDGRFRLPPRVIGARARVRVLIDEDEVASEEIDLTSPGRAEITIKAKRPRPELVWIKRDNAYQVDELQVSDQAKRHVRRHVDAGHLVVIPRRMVRVGTYETAGFYALDPKSGSVIGVTEDGLHGANTAELDAWRAAAESALKNIPGALREGAEGGFGAIHMLRGALVAWWLYSAYRLEEADHAAALIRCLKEMDYWEEATNMLSGVGRVAGDEVRSRMADLIGGSGISIEGDGAQLSFKLGYLGSMLFLDKKLGNE